MCFRGKERKRGKRKELEGDKEKTGGKKKEKWEGKKESAKEKRNRKKDFLENKENVFKIVLPSLVVICLIICFIVAVFTRPRQ